MKPLRGCRSIVYKSRGFEV